MEWYRLQGTNWETYVLMFCGRVVAYEVGPYSYALWPTKEYGFQH